MPFFELQGTS